MRGTRTLAAVALHRTWFLYVGIGVCMESGMVVYDAVGLTGSWTSQVQNCTSSQMASRQLIRSYGSAPT